MEVQDSLDILGDDDHYELDTRRGISSITGAIVTAAFGASPLLRLSDDIDTGSEGERDRKKC